MGFGALARVLVVAVLGVWAPVSIVAQTTTQPVAQPSIVAVLEVDRMFSESLWGQRVATEIQAAVTELEAQNLQLETDLAVEEAALTEMRVSTEPAEFAALADAFDEKVRAIRQATENKVAALNQSQQTEFNRFRTLSEPVLIEVAAEMNASVILDKRSVYLALDGVDITDRVISRIDSTFGGGSTAE